MKMEIKIKKEPVVTGGDAMAHSYRQSLQKAAGQWLTVETEYLFKDQFNTAPDPNLGIPGLRVMIRNVEDIRGDVRDHRMRCNYCGKCPMILDACPHCGRADYLEKFQGRFMPTPQKNRERLPKFKRLLKGSKAHFGKPLYVVNGSMGSAGASLDSYSHIVEVAQGWDRGNGFQGYHSFDFFMRGYDMYGKAIPSHIKKQAIQAAEDYAKICGFDPIKTA